MYVRICVQPILFHPPVFCLSSVIVYTMGCIMSLFHFTVCLVLFPCRIFNSCCYLSESMYVYAYSQHTITRTRTSYLDSTAMQPLHPTQPISLPLGPMTDPHGVTCCLISFPLYVWDSPQVQGHFPFHSTSFLADPTSIESPNALKASYMCLSTRIPLVRHIRDVLHSQQISYLQFPCESLSLTISRQLRPPFSDSSVSCNNSS